MYVLFHAFSTFMLYALMIGFVIEEATNISVFGLILSRLFDLLPV